MIKDVDLTEKNPEKETLLIMRSRYGDRLSIWIYKNNPEIGFISLNDEMFPADKYELRKFQSGFMKLGKKLGYFR